MMQHVTVIHFYGTLYAFTREMCNVYLKWFDKAYTAVVETRESNARAMFP